jgi:hypothetical protein
MSSSDFDPKMEKCIFKLNSNFLNEEKKKDINDFACWRRFEGAINALYLDKKVSKPEVFDILRIYIYSSDMFDYVFQTKFINSLDTLNDNDIRIIALQMQCKIFDPACSLKQITDFVPSNIANYLLNRVETAFQAQMV